MKNRKAYKKLKVTKTVTKFREIWRVTSGTTNQSEGISNVWHRVLPCWPDHVWIFRQKMQPGRQSVRPGRASVCSSFTFFPLINDQQLRDRESAKKHTNHMKTSNPAGKCIAKSKEVHTLACHKWKSMFVLSKLSTTQGSSCVYSVWLRVSFDLCEPVLSSARYRLFDNEVPEPSPYCTKA